MTERLSFTVDEAAQAVGVSAHTIREAYRSGDLAIRYAGTKVLILADDLRSWLEALPTERAS